MTDVQPSSRSPGEAIYREAKAAHETGKSLLPLLALLEEPEGPSSLDDIKGLLSTIVSILGQHSKSLAEIQSRVGRAGLASTG